MKHNSESVHVLIFDDGVEIVQPPKSPDGEDYARCEKYYCVPKEMWDLAYAIGFRDGKHSVR